MDPLVQAIDEALAYLHAHPDVMTRAEVNEFCRLADRVYDLAFRAGLLHCLPQVTELRPQLEPDGRMHLPPPQFESKLNLPGDWEHTSATSGLPPSYPLCGFLPDGTPLVCEEEPPAVPERVFLVCPTPRWFADMEALRRLALQAEPRQMPDQESPPQTGQNSQPKTDAEGVSGEPEVAQYVTLDQMAAHVNRSKRTLERLKTRKTNPLPTPDVAGGGGRPDEWDWSIIRPWLEEEFGRRLPPRFPPRL